MKIRAQFPSKYLKAADLDDSSVTWTISGVTMEKMLDGTNKPCVNFNETDQLLVLNKTNANKLEDAYGDETDDWEGQPVTLYSAIVEFQGKSVEAIRVRIPKETAPENRPVPAVEGRPAVRPPAQRPVAGAPTPAARAVPEGKERVGSTRAAPPQQYSEVNPPPPSRPNYDPDLDDEIPF